MSYKEKGGKEEAQEMALNGGDEKPHKLKHTITVEPFQRDHQLPTASRWPCALCKQQTLAFALVQENSISALASRWPQVQPDLKGISCASCFTGGTPAVNG